MDNITRWPEQKKVLPDSQILSPSLPPEEHVGTRRTAYIVADMRLTVELLVEAEIAPFSYCIFSFVLAGMHFRAKTRKTRSR